MYETIKAEVDQLVAKFNAARADGKITVAEVGMLLGETHESVVDIVEVLNVPGADKKALALQAVGEVYDRCIEPFDLPYVPDGIADPILRRVVLQLADGAIEYVVRKLKDQPAPTPTGAAA